MTLKSKRKKIKIEELTKEIKNLEIICKTKIEEK